MELWFVHLELGVYLQMTRHWLFSLPLKVLGLATVVPAVYGISCAISFVAPAVLAEHLDNPLSFRFLASMAVISLALTLVLLAAGVHLLAAQKPRLTLLVIAFATAWLYHGLVLILPDLLSDSARLSFSTAAGVANTTLVLLQRWHIPMIGTLGCILAILRSRTAHASRSDSTA